MTPSALGCIVVSLVGLFMAYATHAWVVVVLVTLAAWGPLYVALRSKQRWTIIHALSQAGVGLELTAVSS